MNWGGSTGGSETVQNASVLMIHKSNRILARHCKGVCESDVLELLGVSLFLHHVPFESCGNVQRLHYS